MPEQRSGELFDVAFEPRGSELWVQLSGDLDLDATDELDEALSLACRSDAERVVIDLRGLDFLDSTGLGVLVRHCHGPDRPRLSVIQGEGLVRRVFQISGLEDRLPFRPAPNGDHSSLRR